MKRPKGKFVILSILQGRPSLIQNDDGETAVFPTREAAVEVTTRPLAWAQSAENIMVIDCNRCEIAEVI